MNPTETLTEEALILKLRGGEHDFVERKPRAPARDWLQTAVAFANSTPIGSPAVLFVGVDDDGTPQQGAEKLEDLAKSVSGILDRAYPPFYFDIRPLPVGDRACLAVVIPGSERRPHFAGRSYVRVGPETREASEEQFSELVASRNSKAREIQVWAGKEVSFMQKRRIGSDNHYKEFPANVPVKIRACGPHYATFSKEDSLTSVFSEPLGKIELGYDNVRQRLWIYIYEDR